MRSRSMSFLLPAIALLCAFILPAGASAQPVPAISPPTLVQPATIGVDLGAQDFTVFAYVERDGAGMRLVETLRAVQADVDLMCGVPSSYLAGFLADARLPTVPGVTVGGGSSG